MNNREKLKKLERLKRAIDHRKRLNTWSLASHAGSLNSVLAEAARYDKSGDDVAGLEFMDLKLAFRASLQPKITELTAVVETQSRQASVFERRVGEVSDSISLEKRRTDELSDLEALLENLGRSLQQNRSALHKRQLR
jgi:hypothetical protein